MIVVSVCFSWALDPLSVVTECLYKTFVMAQKPKENLVSMMIYGMMNHHLVS